MNVPAQLQKLGEKLTQVPEHSVAKEATWELVIATGCLAVEKFTGNHAAGRVGKAVGAFAVARLGYAIQDTLTPSKSGPAPALHETIAAQAALGLIRMEPIQPIPDSGPRAA